MIPRVRFPAAPPKERSAGPFCFFSTYISTTVINIDGALELFTPQRSSLTVATRLRVRIHRCKSIITEFTGHYRHISMLGVPKGVTCWQFRGSPRYRWRPRLVSPLQLVVVPPATAAPCAQTLPPGPLAQPCRTLRPRALPGRWNTYRLAVCLPPRRTRHRYPRWALCRRTHRSTVRRTPLLGRTRPRWYPGQVLPVRPTRPGRTRVTGVRMLQPKPRRRRPRRLLLPPLFRSQLPHSSVG